MITETKLTELIIEYDKNQNTIKDTNNLAAAISEIYEIQAKLISRLNSYHSDLLMLDYDPYLAFDMNPEISLLKNQEVYDLIGIEPPIDSMHERE